MSFPRIPVFPKSRFYNRTGFLPSGGVGPWRRPVPRAANATRARCRASALRPGVGSVPTHPRSCPPAGHAPAAGAAPQHMRLASHRSGSGDCPAHHGLRGQCPVYFTWVGVSGQGAGVALPSLECGARLREARQLVPGSSEQLRRPELELSVLLGKQDEFILPTVS